MIKPRYHNSTPEKTWRDLRRISEVLEVIIPESCSRAMEIGVTGPSALLMFQESRRIGPKWNPVDKVDVYVSGRFGRSDAHFLGFVERALKLMKVKSLASGIRSKQLVRDMNGVHSWVVDVWIEGVGTTVSFVQRPNHVNVLEVAKTFDINVCQIVFDPRNKEFWYTDGLIADISNCTARVSDLSMSVDGPTDEDIENVRSTLERIAAYERRGFRFANGDGIAFVHTPAGAPSPGWKTGKTDNDC